LRPHLRAQEDAYVDARSGAQPRPDAERGIGYGGGIGCGHACMDQDPIEIELVKMIAIDTAPPQSMILSKHIRSRSIADTLDVPVSDSRPLRTVEWVARITNRGHQTLYFPTSLLWSGDEQQIGKMHVVLELSLSLNANCSGGERQNALDLWSGVSLYGTTDQSSDVAPVEPGHWITVVGMAAACPIPTDKDDKYQVDMSLSKVRRYQKNGKNIEEHLPLLGSYESRSIRWTGEGIWVPDAVK
jgi:hypothetical protein